MYFNFAVIPLGVVGTFAITVTFVGVFETLLSLAIRRLDDSSLIPPLLLSSDKDLGCFTGDGAEGRSLLLLSSVNGRRGGLAGDRPDGVLCLLRNALNSSFFCRSASLRA